MSDRPEFIWEGVYESFAAAGGDEGVFESETWLSRSHARAVEIASGVPDSNHNGKSCDITDHYCLPEFAATVARLTGVCRILDFGGAAGFSFNEVATGLSASDKLDFLVVENANLCAIGEDVYAHDDRIRFNTDLPVESSPFDIVHVGSALQYIDDWKSLLGALAGYRAPLLILDDVMAGPQPTYVTLQNYYGQKIPSWFWNADEFLAAVSQTGYRLIKRSLYRGRFFGERQPLPMGNFPDRMQVQHTSHFVFVADTQK
ncbi:MAG: methyltransferase, TIGR04325 family [Alphaproteobacteria bacterium]